MTGFLITMGFIGYVWYRLEKRVDIMQERINRIDDSIHGR